VRARDGLMAWMGVGNVEGVLVHAPAPRRRVDYITQRGGIVGAHLPTLHESALRVSAGDTLLLATDGIAEGFTETDVAEWPPQALAEQILRMFGRSTDDALVVVAKWRDTG